MSYSPDKTTPFKKDVADWAKESAPLLRAALRNPLQISALLAISPFVARFLCSYISDTTRRILELGGGTGALTGLVRDVLHEDGQLFVIEKNPKMVKFLQDRFKQANIVIHDGDAVNLDTIIDGQVDIVFSSIPISVIPEAIAMQIIEKVHYIIKEGGLFICFQNRDVADGYIRKVFGEVTTEVHKKHIPEQIITIATKSA